LLFSIDWLVLADDKSVGLAPDSKRYFFDAGGTRFMDAMHFFTSKYQERGIVFDHIYVWEAVHQTVEAYWAGTPPTTRAFWEPRLSFFNGVPVTADLADMTNNPVNRIHQLCGVKDFCAFKLDIDTPSVELQIVQQLLASPTLGEVLDEVCKDSESRALIMDNVNAGKIHEVTDLLKSGQFNMSANNMSANEIDEMTAKAKAFGKKFIHAFTNTTLSPRQLKDCKDFDPMRFMGFMAPDWPAIEKCARGLLGISAKCSGCVKVIGEELIGTNMMAIPSSCAATCGKQTDYSAAKACSLCMPKVIKAAGTCLAGDDYKTVLVQEIRAAFKDE